MKIIRDYATDIISKMPDSDIFSILLQLIQSIQYDVIDQSSMASHLIERSKSNKQIAIFIYWYLKTENETGQTVKGTKNIAEKVQIYKNVFYTFKKTFEDSELAETWEIIEQQEKFVSYLRDLSKAMKEMKNNSER